MLKLIIEDDEGRKTVVPFSRDEITIGRQEGNTIRLTERNVSRHHARLVRQNGHVLVEDLGSYTGVLINGERIQGQVQVGDGDHIQIGDYDLALQREASKQPGPPTVRVPTVAPAPDPDVTAEFKTETNLPIPGDSEGEGPPTPAMSQGAQVEMNRPRRASKSRVFALGAVVLLGVGAAWLLFGQPPASPPPPRQPVMAEKPPEPPRATQAARVQDPATSTGTQPSDTTEQPAEKPPLADSHIEAMPSTGTTHRATVEQARQLHHEGVMLIRKQQLPEAESVLKKCITLKPTYAPCHLALGSAAARRNRPEESTQYYREFLRLAPNHEMAPSVRKLVADHDKSQKQPGGGK